MINQSRNNVLPRSESLRPNIVSQLLPLHLPLDFIQLGKSSLARTEVLGHKRTFHAQLPPPLQPFDSPRAPSLTALLVL